jgi:hypothetical protein
VLLPAHPLKKTDALRLSADDLLRKPSSQTEIEQTSKKTSRETRGHTCRDGLSDSQNEPIEREALALIEAQNMNHWPLHESVKKRNLRNEVTSEEIQNEKRKDVPREGKKVSQNRKGEDTKKKGFEGHSLSNFSS